MCHAKRKAHKGGSNNGEKRTPLYAPALENEENYHADYSNNNSGLGKISKRERCLLGVGCDDVRIAEANDRDKKAYAGTDGDLDSLWNEIDDGIPDAKDRNDDEEHAGKKYKGSRRFYGNLLELYHGDRENRDRPKTGSQYKGTVRIQCHAQCCNDDHSNHGRQDRPGRKPGASHHTRYYGKYVGHGRKCSNTGDNFSGNGAVEFIQLETGNEPFVHWNSPFM